MVFFFFSFFFFFFFSYIIFSLSFHARGRAKNVLLLTINLWGFTKPIMSTLKLVKNGGASVLSTMSSIHSMSTILNKGKKKTMKKNKKQKNEQPQTLAYTLVLQTMSSPISSFFFSKPIGFPSKMMPCKLNHNLICLGLEFLSEGLGTNLKLLTNRNAQFHWTLLLGPLSKVALSVAAASLIERKTSRAFWKHNAHRGGHIISEKPTIVS